MAWYIEPNINEGYPTCSEFPEKYPTGWTKPFADAMWRIADGQNEGYPFIGYWFSGAPSGGAGDMVIGGSKTNYPNGFKNNNRGGISSQFGNGNFPSKFNANSTAARCSALGISYRSWVINAYGWADIVDKINTDDFINAVKNKFEGFISGVDIFNCVDRIISFPFSLSGIKDSTSDPVTAYGLVDVPLTELSYYHPARVCDVLDFGSIDLDVRQAWEIENIDFSIYLPYAGIYQVDVRNASTIRLLATVDFLNTLIEYYIIADDVPIFTAKGTCGVDITPSNSSGVNMSNFIANIPTMVSASASIVGGIASLGASSLGGISSTLNKAAAGLDTVSSAMPSVSQAADKVSIPKVSYNSPSIGGSGSTMCPPYPALIAKIPKMHNDAIGFGEILGYGDQVQRTISECSGYVKCNNYRCDIIVATDAEKAEIENLMNNGVFV